jgi:uncharacterized SAM-binding protein YcdF (DUF218 family)
MNVLLVITLISLGITVLSILIEPRRIRNAIYSAISLFFMLLYFGLLVIAHPDSLGARAMLMIPGLLVLMYLGLAVFLVINGVIVVRKEGRSKTTLITSAAGVAMLLAPVVMVILTTMTIPLLAKLLIFYLLMTFYVFASMWCFLLYSFLYSLLPKKPNCKYIIIHGAGLRADGTPTPLLEKRLDKAIAIFNKTKGTPLLVTSGGKGSDEIISESESMKRYLLDKGIPETSIIKEDRSTSTYENLANVKTMLDEIEHGEKYSCIFVTNNYHVLRTAFYSRKLGLNAQGVGCKTARYYLPSAFLREYLAVMVYIKWVSIVYIGLSILLALVL